MRLGKTDKAILRAAELGEVSTETWNIRRWNSMRKLIEAGLLVQVSRRPTHYESRHFVGNAPYYRPHYGYIVRAAKPQNAKNISH